MKKNGFFAFVRKVSLHILRDPRTMLVVLGIPVVQLLLFGFALSTEVNNLDFAVAAPHRSEAVRRVVERIAANDCFTFRGYVEAQQIDRVLRQGEADVVVAFADDFDRRSVALAGENDWLPGSVAGTETLAADALAAGGVSVVPVVPAVSEPNGSPAANGGLSDMAAGRVGPGKGPECGSVAAGGLMSGSLPMDGSTAGSVAAGGSLTGMAAAGGGTLAGVAGGAAVQLLFDASNPNTASAGAGYLQRLLLGDGGAGLSRIEMHLLYNPRMKSAYNFVPGIMGLLFILICSIMTSVSIVREKESGTMEVLLVSPVRPVAIVFAKMIPYFLLSCLDLALILLLARFVLGVPLSGSVAAVVGISILYLLLALALGLFISTIADRQATALVISAMLMLLPVIMLSGMIFPVENMPGVLQALSCVIPARWYIAAVRKLMIQALPFAAVWRECAILLVMTIGLIAVALRKFNDKLE